MLKTYKYSLLPTEDQKAVFAQWFGSCRFVYNLGLEAKIAAWTSLKKNVTCFDLNKQLTELKHTECLWLKECPAQSLESSLANLDSAYTAFFKGGGFPKFKKRSGRQSIQFRQNTVVKDGKVRLSKMGWVDFVEHRPFGEGEVRTVIVSKVPTGKFFVSILIEDKKDLPEKRAIASETTVGIDMGLKTFATLSDGTQYANPRLLQASLKRLRLEQRKLSRRFKKGVKTVDQSKSWHKQKLVVAKIHEKIKNQREDFLHKVSTEIINRYDTVCLEDLNITGLMKNGKLSKAIADVSWYQFGQFLKYKAEWYGKNIKVIGRFDPSSKICSTCGTINKELGLSDREWICGKCGAEHNRDQNAAINIKNFGLRTKASTVNVAH